MTANEPKVHIRIDMSVHYRYDFVDPYSAAPVPLSLDGVCGSPGNQRCQREDEFSSPLFCDGSVIFCPRITTHTCCYLMNDNNSN